LIFQVFREDAASRCREGECGGIVERLAKAARRCGRGCFSALQILEVLTSESRLGSLWNPAAACMCQAKWRTQGSSCSDAKFAVGWRAESRTMRTTVRVGVQTLARPNTKGSIARMFEDRANNF